MKIQTLPLAALTCALAFTTTALLAQESATDDKTQAAELAKQLSNPVASLISVPIQNNWDFGYGPANAMRYTANVQPVVPFSRNQDWNLSGGAARIGNHTVATHDGNVYHSNGSGGW